MEQRRPKRGQEGGGRQPSEFDQHVVEIKRVTRVVAGGKRMRFRALVVVGDRKGKVGMGLKKGRDVQESVAKAVNQAKKSMFMVPLVRDTIPHDINVKYKASRLIMRPAKPGTGVVAGGAVRHVFDLAGIKNVMTKMVGSSNKVNNISAVFMALQRLKVKERTRKSN